jgi:arsenite methyltransferase
MVISLRASIRRAGIADESVDLVISNCVVNLSPDKQRVIREACRVLRAGGEMHFSDVYADRRVPAALQEDEVSRQRLVCCMLTTSRRS